MAMESKEYLSVWGDTVDLNELIIGLISGAIIGYVSYAGGLWYVKMFHPTVAKNLVTGYALLFGCGGSLLVGIVAAAVTRSKRVFLDDDRGVDKKTALLELNLDLEKEAEYLKDLPKDVVDEMKALNIYDLFNTSGKDSNTLSAGSPVPVKLQAEAGS